MKHTRLNSFATFTLEKNNPIQKAASPRDAHAPSPTTATTPEPCWRKEEGWRTAPSGPIVASGEGAA